MYQIHGVINRKKVTFRLSKNETEIEFCLTKEKKLKPTPMVANVD